MNFVLEDYT